MTSSEPSRLDRIEILLGNLAERQEQLQNRIEEVQEASSARLDRIEQLTESNAKAIAAYRNELRTSLVDLASMVRDVVVQHQAEQAVVKRERDTQLEMLLAESQENVKQHQVFLEQSATFFSEIDQIRQQFRPRDMGDRD